jgi:hypothetical protein
VCFVTSFCVLLSPIPHDLLQACSVSEQCCCHVISESGGNADCCRTCNIVAKHGVPPLAPLVYIMQFPGVGGVHQAGEWRQRRHGGHSPAALGPDGCHHTPDRPLETCSDGKRAGEEGRGRAGDWEGGVKLDMYAMSGGGQLRLQAWGQGETG